MAVAKKPLATQPLTNQPQAHQPQAHQHLGDQHQVNVHQAKTHLAQLLQKVEHGQEVVIARSGESIARLVAWLVPAQPVAAPGAMRGQIALANDFDAPLAGLFEAMQ